MANNFDSNTTNKLNRVFLDHFDSNRVVTKTVNTQLLDGKFNPTSGTTTNFKRPTDYSSYRSTDGDVSANKNSIITGKATGTVQNFFTVAADYALVDEALKMDQLDQLIAPMARRIVTDLETDFAAYMAKNCNLSYGNPDNAVDAWSDVAGAGALLSSIGAPSDKPWYYIMSPGQEAKLSEVANSLASGADRLVNNSWEKAKIAGNFAGMDVMCSNALSTRTQTIDADMAGALNGAPDVTYTTAKDTMTQSWVVDGFAANTIVRAGDIVEVTGRYRVSSATKLPIFDSTGAQILFRATVIADTLLSGTGTGTIVVAGPGLYEAGIAGGYNTTSAALADNDVITIVGTSGVVVQPALFYHPDAYGLGTVKLPKLNGWDSVGTTEDGFSIRCTKYSNGDTNTQSVRFDLLPAYATFNPFMAGQGFGV